METDYRYQVGGSLPSNAPSYVTRKADHEFYRCLSEGEFCYVLNSRQMGKSSLRVRTMQKLRQEGTVCAAVDLTGFGIQGLTADRWYRAFVEALVSDCQLSPSFNLRNWWQEQRDNTTPVQRLRTFVEKALLQKIQQNIVVFVDEIDYIISQASAVDDFSGDDFLTLIRFFYNQRVDQPAYQRLTFALLGVSTPSALMGDQERTSFNIGRAIYLEGFQLQEAMPLADGLAGKVPHPDRVLNEILDWTGGQPFLTQKLCKCVEESVRLSPDMTVEQVVQSRILDNWASQDEPVHLRTICDRILFQESKAVQLLGLYQQIWNEGEVTATGSTEQLELRLSGLVGSSRGKLKVYNRIYRQIFDQDWIRKTLKELRPYADAFNAWETSQTHKNKLLAGKALREALDWAVGKSLSDRDYEFIRLSQVKETQEKQKRNVLIRTVLAVLGLGGLLIGGAVLGSNRWQVDSKQKNTPQNSAAP